MSNVLHRDPRTMVPDLIDWFEEPFVTLRPYLAKPIRVEDYLTGDQYTVRAELAGVDPEKDVEVTVGSGYLTIHAERYDKTEGKHRSEFRYGAFTRSLPLPSSANEDDVRRPTTTTSSRSPSASKPEEGARQEDRGRRGRPGSLPPADLGPALTWTVAERRARPLSCRGRVSASHGSFRP